MVQKKSWEYSVSLELFSSTLPTILRKTRILLGQCFIILQLSQNNLLKKKRHFLVKYHILDTLLASATYIQFPEQCACDNFIGNMTMALLAPIC